VTGTFAGLDRVYLARACELAERGRSSTSPNPPVGAVIARGTSTLGEGFHRVRGAPHAESEALRDAAERGTDVRGATLYVTLEPCDHMGLTPPCSQAVIDAGIARVVIGTPDPNPRTARAGLVRLRAAGVSLDVVDDEWSRRLVAEFAVSSARMRPYLRLKMASSLDGCIAPRPGEPYWLTGHEARAYVRELRARHDAVLVGAGTVRADDPQLTVRPAFARRKPYRRVIVCEDAAVPTERAVFADVEGYAPTIVLAPAGLRARFADLQTVADVLYVGAEDALRLDLADALESLRARDIATIVCEGGPTLAGALIARGFVDRFDWLIAPTFFANGRAMPVLAGAEGDSGVSRDDGARQVNLRYDRIEALGADVLISGIPLAGKPCSAA